MTTIMGSISNIVQEVITPKIDLLTLQVSPFFRHVFRDSRNVTTNPHIGRDWKVIRTFTTGLGGAVEFGSLAGGDMQSVGSATGYQAYNQVETWPGLPESVAPAYVQRTITLKKMKVNMHVPFTIMRAAKLGASIGDQLERTINATALNVAYAKSNAFLASAPTSGYAGVIGQFTSDSAGGSRTISSSGLQVTLDTGSSIRRFCSGQRVDLFEEGNDTRLNSEPVFVDIVDGFGTSASPITDGGGTLKLFHLGSNTTVCAAGTQYDIVPRNSGRETGTLNMPTSLSDIIVDSSNIADWGISASNYTLLKSMIRDLNNAVLTEGLLLKFIAHYVHARGTMYMFDDLWSTAGVWAGYFNNLDSAYTIERNGTVLKVRGGVAEEVTFNLYGNSFGCKADAMLPTNIVWGLKTSDQNWSMVVPPRLPSTGRSPVFDPGMEFLAPLAYGGKSIFMPYRKVGGADAGAFTDFLEAPAEHPYEIMPEVVCGMKLTGVKEFYG